MTNGRKAVLLTGGYDKGRFGDGKRQQKSIEAAKKLVRKIKRER